MAFSGRIYWQEYQDCIRYWDSATGVIQQLLPNRPTLPAAVSAAGYVGNLTLLPDGRIHSYLDQRNGGTDPWAVVFSADLDPASGEAWHQPAVRTGTAYYDGAQIVTDTANGVIWVPWYESSDGGLTGTFLQSFDSTGAPIAQKETFNDFWAVMNSGSWNYATTIGNGVLAGTTHYRIVYSQNWIERYDLATGQWSITRSGIYGLGGGAPVGVLNNGEVAYLTIVGGGTPMTCQIGTISGDPWAPIDTPNPGTLTTPTFSLLGSSFKHASKPGSVLIHDDHAYYPEGVGADSRWVEQDLSTGIETTLFTNPDSYFLYDGTPTTGDDPNWYYNYGGDSSSVQGAIAVPGLALDIVGQIDNTRVRFL